MATLAYRTHSNRAVEKLSVEKDTVFWDRELTGFGVRVYPSGGKVYVAQARGPDGPKRVTVGRHGVLGAEQARQRAALIIARVKAGEAPVPEPLAVKQSGGPTVSELAERFLEEHAAARYKTATLAWTRTVLGRYILPQFGKLLGHNQVETTARYAHLARDSVHESAARIADSLAADILGDDWRLQAT